MEPGLKPVVNQNRAADPARRQPENAPGPFFIDEECISCGACWRIAPGWISSHPVHTFAFFSQQPQTAQEKELCLEALAMCPVGAIGKEETS
jgi:ferredoxin